METVEDCKQWFKLIGRLALTGGISGKSAQEASRAVSELRNTILNDQAEELRQLRHRVKTLKADLEQMKRARRG